MTLEEQSGVDPLVERRCAECGATLTEQEIKASLDGDGRFLCSVHATEQVPLDEELETDGG